MISKTEKDIFNLEDFDKEKVKNILISFIQNEIEKFGFKKVVVGLSGGIDSALSCTLATLALGKDNVIPVFMPYKTSSKESYRHAKLLCEKLDLKLNIIDITPQIDMYFEKVEKIFPTEKLKLRKANKMARERMSILYDIAYENNALVLGTSNKSEILLGYFTRWGDQANDLNPIGDLYKTQVWELSKYLNIPEEIIKKPPSADLWVGQTDEKEIGVPYKVLDKILYGYVDLRISKEKLYNYFERNIVNKIISKVNFSQYKRLLPIICKISGRCIDKEFLYARDIFH